MEVQIKKQFEQIMEQKDKEIDRLIAEVKKAQKTIASQNQMFEK